MPEINSIIQYRDITAFPGYRVGDDGSVWSRRAPIFAGVGGKSSLRGKKPALGETWKQLKHWYLKGYAYVTLYPAYRKRPVHQLVLEAFVGPCPAGMQACHWDGNRKNPKLSNLRYDTPKANEHDKKRHGTWFRRGRQANSAQK